MSSTHDQLELPPLACRPDRPRPSFVALGVFAGLIAGYAIIISLATMMLRGPGIMPEGNELNPHRASFTATNAITLTGFQISIGHPQSFSTRGKVIVLVLTVLGTCVPLILGGMAMRRILRLPWGDRRLVLVVLGIEAAVLMAGLLAPIKPVAADTAPSTTTSVSGEMPASRPSQEFIVNGMLQTAAAWGNSGVHAGSPPRPGHPFTHIVLLPLAVLGGLGITVLIELVDALALRRPLSRHAKTVLALAAGFYFAGFVVIFAMQIIPLWPQQELPLRKALPVFVETLQQRNWVELMGRASMLSINVRTAGMEIIDISSFSRVMAFLLVLLMFVGAAPGGTGGGLKTTTLAALWRGACAVLRGEKPSRSLGYAMVWTGIFIALLLVGHLRLLSTSAQTDDRVLMMITSALSNVGLSHDRMVITGAVNPMMLFTMVVGRTAPLAILWWIAASGDEVDVVVG